MLNLRQLKHILSWTMRGKPVPPPHIIKQRVVKQYQKDFGIEVFVETGTYLGDMVNAVKGSFKAIYSIELGEDLYSRARELFAAYPHIKILLGDSGLVLPQALQEIAQPSLFWLDGHFSAGITARGDVDYPVLDELEHIRKHKINEHVILIDDARLFDGTPGVPTIEQISASILQINPHYTIEKRDDVIRAAVRK